jgi:hypothetical protein
VNCVRNQVAGSVLKFDFIGITIPAAFLLRAGEVIE